MPKIASLIQTYRHPDGTVGIKVDGEEFPWLLTDEGPRIGRVASDTWPTVTVTLLADRVEVINDMGPTPPEDADAKAEQRHDPIFSTTASWAEVAVKPETFTEHVARLHHPRNH